MFFVSSHLTDLNFPLAVDSASLYDVLLCCNLMLIIQLFQMNLLTIWLSFNNYKLPCQSDAELRRLCAAHFLSEILCYVHSQKNLNVLKGKSSEVQVQVLVMFKRLALPVLWQTQLYSWAGSLVSRGCKTLVHNSNKHRLACKAENGLCRSSIG